MSKNEPKNDLDNQRQKNNDRAAAIAKQQAKHPHPAGGGKR